jgi:hypothetical protein
MMMQMRMVRGSPTLRRVAMPRAKRMRKRGIEVLFLPSGDLNVSVRSMNASSRYSLRGIVDDGSVFFGCKY